MRRALLGALSALVLSVLGGGAVHAACADNRLEIRGDFGTARFRIVVADTPAERAQGLMNVEAVPRMAGMLFVYERPQAVAFWMENTLIPLDMIFADETGTVQRIHENAIPLDRTPIPGGDDIQFVFEVNGGLSEELGFGVGDQFRHPSIPQDRAAWPCEEE